MAGWIRDETINTREELLGIADVENFQNLTMFKHLDEIESQICEEIRQDVSLGGLVLNIHGRQGVGKTSFVNVLLDEISKKCGAKVTRVDYHTFFYGNATESLSSFFLTYHRQFTAITTLQRLPSLSNY